MKETEKEMTEWNFKVCKVMDMRKVSFEEAISILKANSWNVQTALQAENKNK